MDLPSAPAKSDGVTLSNGPLVSSTISSSSSSSSSPAPAAAA